MKVKKALGFFFVSINCYVPQYAYDNQCNVSLAWLRMQDENCSMRVLDILDGSWDIKVEEIEGVPTLDLKELGLTSLEGIDKIPGIERVENLFLTHNHLRSVKELQSLPSLKRLWLGHNELLTLPEGLDELTQLIKLCLHNNELTSLKGLEKLKLLTDILCVRGNKLTSLAGIESLQELTGIDIADNPLHSYGELKHLSQLKVVYMDVYQNTEQVKHYNLGVEIEVYKTGLFTSQENQKDERTVSLE
jgi:hypothetical protein